MSKTSIHTLLALAVLAILRPVVLANDVRSTIEELPIAPQQETRSENAVYDAFDLKAEISAENSPAGELISDNSPFVANGWDECVSDCGNTTCCRNDGIPDCCSTCGDDPGKRRITADVELMALRTHFGEVALGKLAEKYELSERIVLGVENANGIGGRIRYWSYDRTTPNLQGGSSLRADWDVIDFEGTTRVGTKYFDLILSGGVRWADIKIDIDRGRTRNDMPGASFGLDLRGLICRDCQNGLEWRSVSGARWSIFGGDWECSRGLIPPTRDDNLTVTEIYGGVECSHCCHGREVYARLVMEAQNWRSDALGEATDVDSMSFIGPGFNLGMNF